MAKDNSNSAGKLHGTLRILQETLLKYHRRVGVYFSDGVKYVESILHSFIALYTICYTKMNKNKVG